ncbi:uncharacterized protein MONBRDRAFT_23603 [Monosiga brevicollis MX1]|uniref:Uncharacterized protein n=1 Tax=Monosiga brevicollis TaxID=81824 RepID=A9UTX6_MONBE|nr:uncharacterized protein MONBRDRAFT_23603 [Monosiga brevicollis MX1]EDQ91323.1 predicted protein [Monosiga brevicollis MX1]|eukprot:XP_001743745.1 hypothetical protein [Monosiga brevicollis MX1]
MVETRSGRRTRAPTDSRASTAAVSKASKQTPIRPKTPKSTPRRPRASTVKAVPEPVSEPSSNTSTPKAKAKPIPQAAEEVDKRISEANVGSRSPYPTKVEAASRSSSSDEADSAVRSPEPSEVVVASPPRQVKLPSQSVSPRHRVNTEQQDQESPSASSGGNARWVVAVLVLIIAAVVSAQYPGALLSLLSGHAHEPARQTSSMLDKKAFQLAAELDMQFSTPSHLYSSLMGPVLANLALHDTHTAPKVPLVITIIGNNRSKQKALLSAINKLRVHSEPPIQVATNTPAALLQEHLETALRRNPRATINIRDMSSMNGAFELLHTCLTENHAIVGSTSTRQSWTYLAAFLRRSMGMAASLPNTWPPLTRQLSSTALEELEQACHEGPFKCQQALGTIAAPTLLQSISQRHEDIQALSRRLQTFVPAF